MTFDTWNRAGGAEVELYAAPGSFTSWAAGGMNWALVGDTAHAGPAAFRNTVTNTGTMAGAEALLANPATQVYSASEVAPYINYMGSGADGGFGGNRAVPGQTMNEDIDYYVTLATTTTHVPTTGSYTFGYIGDEGFKLTIYGATFDKVYNCTLVNGNTITTDSPTSGTGSPRLGIIDNLPAGDYNVRFVWGEGSGGSTAEVFAAAGRWTAWSANAFFLVGAPAVVPTAPGGWNATTYKQNSPANLNTLALAETLITTPSLQSWTANENAPYINYNNDSTAGGQNGYYSRFYVNTAPAPANNNNPGASNLLPADQVADRQIPEPGGATAALDYFVVAATTQIVVPSTGTYTFMVTSDDQFKLTIDSVSAPGTVSFSSVTACSIGTWTGTTNGLSFTGTNNSMFVDNATGDRLGVINNLPAGTYNVRLLWVEQTGGAGCEVYAGLGAMTAWNSMFMNLVGLTNTSMTASQAGAYPITTGAASSRPVNNLADAERIASDWTKQQWSKSELAAYVNYIDAGTTASTNYYWTAATPSNVADRAYPGLTAGTEVDDFVTLATGAFVIPAAGQYTFGVNADEGFKLDFTGGNRLTVTAAYGTGATFTATSFQAPGTGSPATTLAVVNFPYAGTFSLRLLTYTHTGGAEVELFAATGAYTSFDPSALHLVGDTLHGGLQVGTSQMTTNNDLGAAESFQAQSGAQYTGIPAASVTWNGINTTPTAFSRTEQAPYLNYTGSSGSAGYFTGVAASPQNIPDRAFPGLMIGPDDNDFTLSATGVLHVPTAGWWTFDVNHDDGFGLYIRGNGLDYIYQDISGTTERYLQVNFPVAGDYNVRATYYERMGPSHFELAAIQGQYTSRQSGERLVGDQANGGLPVGPSWMMNTDPAWDTQVPDINVTTYQSVTPQPGLAVDTIQTNAQEGFSVNTYQAGAARRGRHDVSGGGRRHDGDHVQGDCGVRHSRPGRRRR